MPTITVVRAFMLQLEPKQIRMANDIADPTKQVAVMGLPEKIFFQPGVHEVTDEVANHWYTKLHLDDYVEPPKGPGTAEYQAAEQATAPQQDPADPILPAPQTSTAPRPAHPPPSAGRSVPRGPSRA